jgi:cell division ATPase FtsA
MGMPKSHLDHLDDIAQAIREKRKGAKDHVGVLSTGERIYVALAANDIKLAPGYTIVEAIARLGDDDVRALVERWQYRG